MFRLNIDLEEGLVEVYETPVGNDEDEISLENKLLRAGSVSGI